MQCTGWGWPISSAAPEIDFHLTSEALAPAAADAYFHEPLVRLRGLPAFAPRLRAQPSASPPESFGLPAGATLYLCPQNLLKVHPDFDEILGGILRSDCGGSPRSCTTAHRSSAPRCSVAGSGRCRTSMSGSYCCRE